jgi:hypothetical protein
MSRPLLKITDHVLGVEAQVLSDLDEGNLLAVDPMVDGLHGYAEEICDFRGTEEFLGRLRFDWLAHKAILSGGSVLRHRAGNLSAGTLPGGCLEMRGLTSPVRSKQSIRDQIFLKLAPSGNRYDRYGGT